MRVRLVAHTIVDVQAMRDEGYVLNEDDNPTDADELAEFGGRLCYLSWQRPNPKTATNEGYLRNILNQRHYSVLEHSSLTFAISGVSRSFTHELVRHRHLSFSQVSQRYVDESASDFVPPPGASEEELIHLTQVQRFALGAYRGIYDNRVERGFSRKEARQAARAVLPNAVETRILVSGNLRAWREVIQKRNTPQADAEFQLVARELLRLVAEKAPNSVADLWEGNE